MLKGLAIMAAGVTYLRGNRYITYYLLLITYYLNHGELYPSCHNLCQPSHRK